MGKKLSVVAQFVNIFIGERVCHCVSLPLPTILEIHLC